MSLHIPDLVPRPLVQETPVAIVCNGSTLGVMMASPTDLKDFAIGFALTEGLVEKACELEDLEVIHHDIGVEARFWLKGDAAAVLAARQRALIGPVGCGLCGIDSLAKVDRALPRLPDGSLRLPLTEVCGAPAKMRAYQPEHDRTRACHAAGFFRQDVGIVVAREDVGRHNALDKLAGAIAQAEEDPATGAVVLTSRISTEMVQKTVAMKVPMLIAVSGATDYALRLAERANLTLVTRTRGGRCEVLVAPQRVI